MRRSTREIAELAGVSPRAVRHYNQAGVLEAPQRLPNGYKQYRVAHLQQLVGIKRLVILGFGLHQIAAMGSTSNRPGEAMRILDAELTATIEGLERARIELGIVLGKDLPIAAAPSPSARPHPHHDLSHLARGLTVPLRPGVC